MGKGGKDVDGSLEDSGNSAHRTQPSATNQGLGSGTVDSTVPRAL